MQPTVSVSSSHTVCRCHKAFSASPARHRRREGERRREALSPLTFRVSAQGGDDESAAGGNSFADQLWSAAREGVQKNETSGNLSVSATSFLSLEDNITFNINEFFSYAKTLYLKQEFGQALEMYEEVLNEPGKFSLNGFTISQVAPLSDDQPDVMRKDYISARAVCLYNVGCIYTAFGELETAQQFLRDAQGLGMNVSYFLSRGADPTLKSLDNPYVPIVGAVQIVAQLKRFINVIKQGPEKKAKPDYVNPSQPYLKDLEINDEMDTSIPAILKRVAILVAVLSAAGTVFIVAGRLAWYN
jgi:hypothetical protein